MATKKRYLSDGVYAQFDGFYIWLTTLREDGTEHWIALDPAGLSELTKMADTVWKRTEVRE